MSNRYLLPLYKKLFNDDFNYHDFDKRLQMQKAIYLLQEEGVPVGEYGFIWYKHGPYSQSLLDDMFVEKSNSSIDIQLSRDSELSVSKLKDAFQSQEADSYGMRNWTECLASIHYLKTYVLSSKAGKEEVLNELQERKPHLNQDDLNEKAFDYIDELFR